MLPRPGTTKLWGSDRHFKKWDVELVKKFPDKYKWQQWIHFSSLSMVIKEEYGNIH